MSPQTNRWKAALDKAGALQQRLAGLTPALAGSPELAKAVLPVTALTALVMPGDRERCLLASANEYVSKPVRWPELLDTLARQLKGQPRDSP